MIALIATSAQAQVSKASRFDDPTGITADPTGLLRDTSVHAFPRYPQDLEHKQITGAPVVAFVIDTSGRVEIKTATFLNDPRAEFAKAVCDLLPRLHFQPFMVGAQRWRVLLVEMYAFNTWAVPDTSGRRAAASLVSQSQEQFATKPIEQVVKQLDTLPHCEGR